MLVRFVKQGEARYADALVLLRCFVISHIFDPTEQE